LRSQIRAQILSGNAEFLNGVAQTIQMIRQANDELGGQLENLPDQFAVALQLSELNELNGVIAARIFDTNGQFAAALPANVAKTQLTHPDLLQLSELQPLSRFHEQADVTAAFLPDTMALADTNASAPLLELLVPLHHQDQPHLLGVVQFLMDGHPIAAKFAIVDRHLIAQATLVLGAASVLIVLVLTWAFRRLSRANRLLLDRTHRLLRANEELALTAKTSAVGAITAHLVHGMSSPLSGLQDLAATKTRGEADESDWQDAMTSARQVQDLIGEIVRLLSEEQQAEQYEISISELTEAVQLKVQPLAQSTGVRFVADPKTAGDLPNREANLILLILENLLRNAIQATPAGRTVELHVRRMADDDVAFEVLDEGPGVPEQIKSRLFTPCPSTKPRGNGIGLAISKQLANHLEATLTLEKSSQTGSKFVLKLPSRRFLTHLHLDPRA
jgi:signal transduction histidine kinase